MKRTFLSHLNRLLYRAERKTRSWLSPEQFITLPPILNSLCEAYETEWRTAKCIFVLSTGRAGTQSLTHLLSICPEVHSEHEPNPRLIQTSYQYYQQKFSAETKTQQEWKDLVLAARDDLIFQANRDGKIYLETNNRMTYLAPVLAEIFPASQFIHLHRHPFEFVRSGIRRNYYQGHNWDFARIHPAGTHPDAQRWLTMSQMAKVAWNWQAVNQHIMAFFDTLSPDRQMTLAAADLFLAGDAQIAELYNFINVPIPQGSRFKTLLAQPSNQQTDGDFPEYSEWSSQECATVMCEVEEVANALGYQLN